MDKPMSEWSAEDFGRAAVGIEGWRWMPGMLVRATVEGSPSMYRLDGADDGLYKESWILVHESRIYDDTDDVCDVLPCVDDPATAGCLLALLGGQCLVRGLPRRVPRVEIVIPGSLTNDGRPRRVENDKLGRACIAAAIAIGRWPGGAA